MCKDNYEQSQFFKNVSCKCSISSVLLVVINSILMDECTIFGVY